MKGLLQRSLPRLALTLLIAFQALSFERAVGFASVLTDEPVVTDDYAYHYGNALTVLTFLKNGRWWGYDPTFYAGYPAGILSIDNRLLELAMFAAPWLHPAVVQKLYILAYWLSVPLLGWIASRSLGFGAAASIANAALCILLSECTFLYQAARWFGMLAFSWAVFLAPAVLGLFTVLMREWSIARLVAFATASQVLTLVHGLGPILAIAPLSVVLFFHRRDIDRRAVVGLGVVTLLLVCINLTWAIPQLGFRDHVATGTTSSRMLQLGGYDNLLPILLLGKDPFGIGPHYPLFLPALVGLVALASVVGAFRPEYRKGTTLCLVGGAALLALAFSGDVLPAVRESQPLRYLPAAAAFLLPVAALGLTSGLRSVCRSTALYAGVLVVVVGLAFGPLLQPMLRRTTGDQSARFRLGIPGEVTTVARMVEKHTDQSARILVEDSGGHSRHQYGGTHATALLPHMVFRQYMLGPAPYVPLKEDSLVLTECTIGGRRADSLPPAALSLYLQRYNVGWIVAWSQRCKRSFDTTPFIRAIDEQGKFRMYVVDSPRSYFLQGEGNVRAHYDRLELTGLPTGETIVLSYHYLDSLRTDTGHPVERDVTTPDPVGFIRIRNVPDSLTILN